jgi:aspartate-semialdehyde dehydrogenase
VIVSYAIGIIGATGVTGEVTLRVLEERQFPVGDLRLYASQRSAGRRMTWMGRELTVEALEEGRFEGLDVVISATSASLAREWIPRIVQSGAVVIDQSSAFRLDPVVPLVIPEINGESMHSHSGIRREPELHGRRRRDGDRSPPPGRRGAIGDQLVVSGDLRARPRRRV